MLGLPHIRQREERKADGYQNTEGEGRPSYVSQT